MKYIFLSAALFIIPDFFPWLSIPCVFVFLIPLFVKDFNSTAGSCGQATGNKWLGNNTKKMRDCVLQNTTQLTSRFWCVKKIQIFYNFLNNFYFSTYFLWLDHRIQHKKQYNSFFKGFMWGLLTFAIKFLWFLMMILTIGCDGIGTISGVLLWIATILYVSLFSGLWIWGTTKASRIEIKFLLTIMHFGFMMFVCMAPFGVLEGYPFFNPLITLAYFPQMLWCLKKIGVIGALSCLILFQLVIAKLEWNLSIVFLIPFLSGFFFYQEPTMKKSNIKYIEPWWYGCSNPVFVGHTIAESIEDALLNFPDAKAFLMPESTFCFEMDDYEYFIPLWSAKGSDVIIMLGGHRQVGEVVRNCFFMLDRGKLVHVYDKKHMMPFVERSVFKSKEIDQTSINDLVNIHGQTYQIFICSEFFFEMKEIKKYPVLLICNESWLYFEYMKNFMVLFIKYFELKYDLPVLYATTKGRFSGEI